MYSVCWVCDTWRRGSFLSSELCHYVSWPIFAIIRSVRTHNNPETTEKQCRIHSAKKKKKSPNPLEEMCWGWDAMRGWSSCLRMSAFIWDAYFMLCQAVYGCLWLTFSSISVFISLSLSLPPCSLSQVSWNQSYSSLMRAWGKMYIQISKHSQFAQHNHKTSQKYLSSITKLWCSEMNKLHLLTV